MAAPAPTAGASSDGNNTLDDAVAAAEAQLEEQESVLRDWRTREATEGGGRPAAEQLAEARKRRDAARRAVQTTQAKLSALQGERREKAKRLDKLMLKQQSSKAVMNPDQALPSVALRGGGDAEVVKEIEALLRENRELEESLGQHDATRLHLEKLQNEKKDTARKIKELKGEEKVMREQLEIKKAELQELQEQVKPSPVRARYEADVARLRKEINGHTAARTQAERESAVHSKRLLRVRQVLGGFLKSEGLKAQDRLPTADDELATRLADHICAVAEKVRTLEKALLAREERAAALQQSSAQAAEELKRLVARRGKEQRRIMPTGLLVGAAGDAMAHGEAADAAALAAAAAAPPGNGSTSGGDPADAAAGPSKPARRAPMPKRPPPAAKGKAAGANQKAALRSDAPTAVEAAELVSEESAAAPPPAAPEWGEAGPPAGPGGAGEVVEGGDET